MATPSTEPDHPTRNTNGGKPRVVEEQAVTPTTPHDHQQQDKRDPFYSIRTTFPRTYHLAVYVAFPLLLLIVICFAFGHGLAALEKDGELDANDALLRDAYRLGQQYASDREGIIFQVAVEVAEACSPSFSSELEQCVTNVSSYILSEDNTEEQNNYVSTIFSNYSFASFRMSFNWADCPRLEDTSTSEYDSKGGHELQQEQYMRQFNEDFEKHFAQAFSNTTGTGEDEDALARAFDDAVNKATGRAGCQTHTAGGALFWFTIMTTMYVRAVYTVAVNVACLIACTKRTLCVPCTVR